MEDVEGYSPLMIAASTNGKESLRLLIFHGANVNHINKYKATPLIEASRYGNNDCLQILLELAKDQIDIKIRDVNNMNAYEYLASNDNINGLHDLINFKSLDVDDLLSLLECCVHSNAEQCFDFVFSKFQSLYNKLNETHLKLLKNILEKIINFSLINFLIIIFKNYEEFTIKILDIQLIIKILIMLNNDKINDNLSQDDIDSKNNLLFLTKVINNHILTTIYKSKTISESLIKTLIYLNQYDLFSNIVKFIKEGDNIVDFIKELKIIDIEKDISNKLSNDNKLSLSEENKLNLSKENKFTPTIENNFIYIIEDLISIDKNNYNLTNIKKKVKSNINVFEEWQKILEEINYHNPLTIIINIDNINNNKYFEDIISITSFRKYFTSILNSDNRNILHLLFTVTNLY